MLKETLNSFNSVLHERVTGPLSGTIIISWSLWNWKIIYFVFFESTTAEKKFEFVGSYKLEDQYLQNLLIYPILSTVFLIAFYPFLASVALRVALWHRRKLMAIKWQFSSEEPISREAASLLRLQIRSVRQEYSDELNSKDEKIKELSDQIKFLTEKDKAPKINLDSLPGRESEEHLIALKLNEKNMGELFRNLGKEIATSEVAVRANSNYATQIAFFVTLDLIERYRPQGYSVDIWKLTGLGKKVLRFMTENP